MITFLTALGICIVLVMACALYVLVWDLLDKKGQSKIDLGKKLYQEIVDLLGTDDENEIRIFIENSVSTDLKG